MAKLNTLPINPPELSDDSTMLYKPQNRRVFYMVKLNILPTNPPELSDDSSVIGYNHCTDLTGFLYG